MKCHLVTVLSSHSLEAMVAVVASQIVQLFCALVLRVNIFCLLKLVKIYSLSDSVVYEIITYI